MKHLLAIALLAGLPPATALPTDLSAEQILAQVDAIRAPTQPFTFHIRLEGRSGTHPLHAEFDTAVLDPETSLVIYRKPLNQRGRALLFSGSTMWIHLPGTTRAIRLAPQQQLAGPASYADVARLAFHVDYRVIGSHPVNQAAGTPLLGLTLKSRSERANYQTIELVVAANGYAPQRADFYAASGKLLRRVAFSGYMPILGVSRPSRLTITDPLHTDDSLELSYSDFHIQALPRAMFQPSYLPNLS